MKRAIAETPRQRTVRERASYAGVGLNSGVEVEVTLLPADPGTGYRFVRTDLPGRPEVLASVEALVDIGRRTALKQGDAEVELTEHLLAALRAAGVDNCRVEVTGCELPNGDGSAVPFLDLVRRAGSVEQDAAAVILRIPEPHGEREDHASAWALPETGGLRLSFTLDYGVPYVPVQHMSLVVTPDAFEKDLAPARTFILLREIEPLRKMGLGKGAHPESLLVVGEEGVIQNTLRFPDEFVRHKVLDLLGDLALLPGRVEGHVLGIRSGHRLHRGILRWIEQQCRPGPSPAPVAAPAPAPRERAEGSARRRVPPAPPGLPEAPLDTEQIQKILPHRYPFLLVDRITEMVGYELVRGVKNVTVSEPFFQGHFPGRPVMPGVLQMEAVAQAAAVLILRGYPPGSKLPFFAAMDEVRFRRPVYPGDVLILEAEAIRMREKTGVFQGRAKVNGEVTVEAVITYFLLDAPGARA